MNTLKKLCLPALLVTLYGCGGSDNTPPPEVITPPPPQSLWSIAFRYL